MIPIGADSETHLISPGCLAPRLVCVSATTVPTLMLRPEGLAAYRRWLTASDVRLVIHNAPFDLGVACAEDETLVPLVFDAYRAGRVDCTIIRQMLIDVALGMRKFRHFPDGRVVKSTYGLDDLVALYYNERLEKVDTWRLRYAFLDGVPLADWPEEAKSYAIGDAVQHLRVWEAQEREIADSLPGGELPDQVPQQRASWALHLMSMWGIRAEAAATERFIVHCEEEIDKMRRELADTKILKSDGSRLMKEIQRRVREDLERRHIKVPLTEKKREPQTDEETLRLTEDPKLHALADALTFVKHLGQWGPVCRAAVQRPVCARYNVIMETGRTSCSGGEGQEGTNFQNPPRKGDVRPAFVPRKGWVFCSTDADTIELRALAQSCLDLLGHSRMAEALVEQARSHGPDLHETLAAGILGIDPREVQRLVAAGDEEVSDARQFAKIPNFGFPGGLGGATLVTYAKGQLSRESFLKWFGDDFAVAEKKGQGLREVWFATWPEMRPYFARVGDMMDRERGEGTVIQLQSGRVRGRCRFTAAANGFFQGRVADAMKEILWRLAEECYTGRCSFCAGVGCDRCVGKGRSALLGSRPVLFLHDEPILEHPEVTASERAERQRQIVVWVLEAWMKDIPCTSSAVLMKHWFKGAKPLWIDGKLVPVKPLKEGKKVKWVHDAPLN